MVREKPRCDDSDHAHRGSLCLEGEEPSQILARIEDDPGEREDGDEMEESEAGERQESADEDRAAVPA